MYYCFSLADNRIYQSAEYGIKYVKITAISSFIIRQGRAGIDMKIKYILGVDGGGTRTTADIADLEGRVLAEAVTGASNYKSAGKKASIENINKAVFGALQKLGTADNIIFDSSCFGMAGNDTVKDQKVYRSIIFNERLKTVLNTSRTMICNDSRIGLEAGSSRDNRIMVICGTGSNCFGINQDGMEAKAGGWDYILGDEGSGYSIALKALKTVMKAYDGRIENTILSSQILGYLGFRSEVEIVEWIYKKNITKEKISEIAAVVCRAAHLGDIASRNILEEEAGEIESIITVVAERLGISDSVFDLVLVGSVFKCRKYFKKTLFDLLEKKFKGINFKDLTKKPVLGAIKMARDNNGLSSVRLKNHKP